MNGRNNLLVGFSLIIFALSAEAQEVTVAPEKVVPSSEHTEGRHFATVSHAENREKARIEIYSPTGAPLYSLPIARGWDEPFPDAAVHERTGASAIGRSARSEVVFINEVGVVLQRVQLFKQAPYSLEKSLHVIYSPDGRYVAVSAMRAPARPDASGVNAFLFIFRPNGELVWRLALPEPSIQALAVSPGGRYVAVSTYDAVGSQGIIQRSYVFSADGERLLAIDHGFTQAAFGLNVAIFATDESALALDLLEGARLFTYVPSDAAGFIVDVAAADSSPFAVLTGESRFASEGFVYERLRLNLLDGEGHQLGVARIDESSASAPEIDIRAGGPAVVLHKKTFIYSWPE